VRRKPSLPGARESNAGDDFAVLWAARRAVRLLNPRFGLRRVFVEKLSIGDEGHSDSNENLFLGVDVSEYYGGNDLSSARRVVVFQLKYSTVHDIRQSLGRRLA
jgi:hypothetical protein